MSVETSAHAHGQGNPTGWPIDLAKRYDELIAAAGGDAPLREFWKLGKRLFQARPGEASRLDRAGPRRYGSGGRP